MAILLYINLRMCRIPFSIYKCIIFGLEYVFACYWSQNGKLLYCRSRYCNIYEPYWELNYSLNNLYSFSTKQCIILHFVKEMTFFSLFNISGASYLLSSPAVFNRPVFNEREVGLVNTPPFLIFVLCLFVQVRSQHL